MLGGFVFLKGEHNMSDECKYQPTSRFWLYIMVIYIFFDSNGCAIKTQLGKMESKLNLIEQKVNRIAVDTQEVITHEAYLEK
jgi:hypothetical protein